MSTTTTTARPAHRIRRIVAGSVIAAAVMTSAGVADAADYDDTSLSGFMKTTSGSVGSAAMQCGRTGFLVFQAQGNIRPNLFSYRATSAAGSTGWTSWQTANSYVRQPIITRPGYWLVEVQIAHFNGRVWTTDIEFAPVSVQAYGYNDRFYCKVTG